MRHFIVVFLLISSFIYGQQYNIKGQITDKSNNEGLTFANVRIGGTFIGTSANVNGYYELKVNNGSYQLIASYIGYISDTINVDVASDKFIKIELQPVSISLPEVTVVPGYNPAIRIIKNAIKFKNERNEKLNSYIFTAYTKGSIRTNQSVDVGSNSLSVGVGTDDSSALKISGILENQSKGYFQKPDNYKEEIIARKQTANFPSSINMLTGGRLIQNFYTNDIQFFDRPLPSPISDDALDYYYYYLKDSLSLDNKKVYEIYFSPIKDYDAGFEGYIYVIDESFALVKVNVGLNKAANTAGIFEKIEIFQQFLPYENNIYMPIDYRLFVEANVLGIAKFGFELNTIMYDYTINSKINEDFFNMAVLTVTPDADKRDSLYWQTVQTIPNTDEEKTAYKEIDSVEAIPKTFWDRFSFLATDFELNENFSLTGPLGLYSFNRVEGHSLNLGMGAKKLFDHRYYGRLNFSYGFSDKKLKSELWSKYYLGEYRTHNIIFNLYDRNFSLFEESVEYNDLTSTILSLFSKYDFRDYYRRKGFKAEVNSLVLPYLTLGVGYTNNHDFSLQNKTDFSFFGKDKKYPINQTINDGRINAITASFELDFRNYIEDGLFIRRINRSKFYAVLSGDIFISKNNLLKSNTDFEIYKMNLAGRLSTFRSSNLFFNMNGVYSTGTVPMQYMYALPGNISSSGKDFSFRSLSVGEVYGDRVVTVSLEHNFRDDLFKILGLPFFKTAEMNLSTYIDIAWVDQQESSYNYLPKKSIKFLTPFYEAGFSLGHPLLPIKFEFTWKLNYKGTNNFTFGINTVLL